MDIFSNNTLATWSERTMNVTNSDTYQYLQCRMVDGNSSLAGHLLCRLNESRSDGNATLDRYNTLNQSNPTHHEDFMHGCLVYDFTIEAVFMGILCVFGLIGNGLSIVCLWRDRSRTATPILLISLAVADNLFLVTVLILRVLTSMAMFYRWTSIVPLVPYMGKYIFPSALIAETGTIYLTLLVTFNRYVSVCQPYEASSMCSVHHAKRHIFLVWLFSCIYNLPRFFEYDITTVYDYQRNASFKIHELSDMANDKIYQIIYSNLLYFLVMFLVPLITLTILNSNLIKALKRTKMKRRKLLSQKDSTNRSEDDITLILIVVVLVFVLCQTPALITQLLISFLPDRLKICPKSFFFYERISDLLVVANSSLNFLIYCFCSRKFRKILRELMCPRFFPHSTEQSCFENGHMTVDGKENFRLRAPQRSLTRYTSIVAHSPKEDNGMQEVTQC